MIEAARRSMVILQDLNKLDLRELADGNPDISLSILNSSVVSNLHINRTEYSHRNELDFLSPKGLIDLAFSAFGMKYYGAAANFLKEASISLSKSQNAGILSVKAGL